MSEKRLRNEVIVVVVGSVILAIATIWSTYTNAKTSRHVAEISREAAIEAARISRNEATPPLSLPYELVQTDAYFPLKVGTRWEYEGWIESATLDGSVERRIATLTMEVEERISDSLRTLYIMKGHPSDGIWAIDASGAPDTIRLTPSRYGYLVISNKIFWVDEKRLTGLENSLRDQSFWKDSLTYEDIKYEFPLYRGLRYGSSWSLLKRNDHLYTWHVQDYTEFHKITSEGVEDSPHFVITHTTLPDHTELTFVPYVGITYYSFSHHGTKGQVDLRLANYHPIE